MTPTARYIGWENLPKKTQSTIGPGCGSYPRLCQIPVIQINVCERKKIILVVSCQGLCQIPVIQINVSERKKIILVVSCQGLCSDTSYSNKCIWKKASGVPSGVMSRSMSDTSYSNKCMWKKASGVPSGVMSRSMFRYIQSNKCIWKKASGVPSGVLSTSMFRYIYWNAMYLKEIIESQLGSCQGLCSDTFTGMQCIWKKS
jgi:hypothetical protein